MGADDAALTRYTIANDDLVARTINDVVADGVAARKRKRVELAAGILCQPRQRRRRAAATSKEIERGARISDAVYGLLG